MSGALGQLLASLRKNGPAWTLSLVAPALARRARSAWAAWCLGAPGLSLGPRCELLGVRHVRWGRGISVRSGLWLEAITSYAGQRFTPRIVLGDRVSFSNGVHVSAIEEIVIGNDVLFGSHVFVADHDHGSYAGAAQSGPGEPPGARPLGRRGAVVIEDRVWIGDGANILGPCRIGHGSIVGAHALVRADVPPECIVAGAPARVVKVFDRATGRWVRPVSADCGG